MLRLALAALVSAASTGAFAAGGGPSEPSLEALLALPVGYAALEVEAAGGADTSAARRALDRAVGAARQRVEAVREPGRTLGALAEAVATVCAPTTSGPAGQLYSEALGAGVCDCDVLTLTYLTAADVLGLPLSAVFLPGHVLLVWDDGRERLYWETTDATARPAWSVEALVPDGAEGAYLRPQGRAEMVGYLYGVRADSRQARGDGAGAEADYGRAVGLNPGLVSVHHNRGRAHLLAGRYAAAAASFSRALALDPTSADARYGRGLAHLLLGRPADALADLDGVLAYEPGSADALHGRGLALAALGRDAEALQSYADALDADPALALVYLARGELHERRGAPGRAREDYLAFIQAAGTAYAADVPEAQRRLLALRER